MAGRFPNWIDSKELKIQEVKKSFVFSPDFRNEKKPIRPELSGDEEKKLPRYFRFEKKNSKPKRFRTVSVTGGKKFPLL